MMSSRAVSLSLLAAAVALPATAQARPITLTTEMSPYSGPGAYVVVYVTDPSGKVVSTLQVSGGKSKYHRHFRDWKKGGGTVDGVTGASIGSGRSLTVQADIADSLIDAGYKIRVDSAVEDAGDVGSDVVVPLDSSNAGKAFDGKGYVGTFQFDM